MPFSCPVTQAKSSSLLNSYGESGQLVVDFSRNTLSVSFVLDGLVCGFLKISFYCDAICPCAREREREKDS